MSIIKKIILDVIRDKGGGKIIDIGCGDGSLLFEIRDYFDYLVGVDISNRFLSKAILRLNSNKNKDNYLFFKLYLS